MINDLYLKRNERKVSFLYPKNGSRNILRQVDGVKVRSFTGPSGRGITVRENDGKFASFSVAITGTDHTYTGNSTDSLDNSWLGGASVAGALYGDSSPDESGGRVNVNLYKSGDTGTAGANDFYFAEGIYLVD